MRKSGKSKAEETPTKVKLGEESENGEASVDEERPVSPTSSKSTRRSKKASSVDGARNKRKKRDDDEDDEEAAEKAEKIDESDEEKIPLSKKMKAVKRTPAKNGLAKGKKRAAELEVKEEYEVESVVGSRLQRGKRQFRIRWKGFNEEDDTWEAEEGLDCTEAIEQYWNTHPEEKPDDEPKTNRATKKVNKKVAKKSDKDAKDGDDSGEEEVSKEEFEVDRITDMFIKKTGKREFLIRWKGYSSKEDTWEPEEHLNCGDLINKYLVKVNAAKSTSEKDLRVSRKPTERFTLTMEGSGRRISRRGHGKQRARYDDAE